jgi:cell shape-determining protein MreC
MKEISNFFGSLIVIAVAIGIFLLLMDKEMPESNRELLISFVSVLFGAMAASLKQVTGADDSDVIKELQRENKELKTKLEESSQE